MIRKINGRKLILNGKFHIYHDRKKRFFVHFILLPYFSNAKHSYSHVFTMKSKQILQEEVKGCILLHLHMLTIAPIILIDFQRNGNIYGVYN